MVSGRRGCSLFCLTLVDLYGAGLKEAAQVDVLIDGVEDFFVGMLKTVLDDKFVRIRASYWLFSNYILIARG